MKNAVFKDFCSNTWSRIDFLHWLTEWLDFCLMLQSSRWDQNQTFFKFPGVVDYVLPLPAIWQMIVYVSVLDSSWIMSFRFLRSFLITKNSRSGRNSRPGSRTRMSGETSMRSGPGGPGCSWTERTETLSRLPILSPQATLPAYLITPALRSQLQVWV